MGTRGTLKIYLNDELKLQQYNQWDSDPTGQFAAICIFLYSRENTEMLADRLLRLSMATPTMMSKWRSWHDPSHPAAVSAEDYMVDLWLTALIDRDIGSDILYLIAGLPSEVHYLPDWGWRCEDSDGELSPEEGNYVLELWCGSTGSFCPHLDGDVEFKVSGEWHGVEREFDLNSIPTKRELDAWENEADDSE